MKIETQKSKTTFKLIVDAKEYLLLVLGLNILNADNIEELLEKHGDIKQNEIYFDLTDELYDTLVNLGKNDISCIDDLYEQFKLEGEFE